MFGREGHILGGRAPGDADGYEMGPSKRPRGMGMEPFFGGGPGGPGMGAGLGAGLGMMGGMTGRAMGGGLGPGMGGPLGGGSLDNLLGNNMRMGGMNMGIGALGVINGAMGGLGGAGGPMPGPRGGGGPGPRGPGPAQLGPMGGPGGGGLPGSSGLLPVVKLRGLPFQCNEMDIVDFFDGLPMVDILMLRRTGRFCGEAFVVFAEPLQVDLAMQKNRQNMGKRYIEVFRSKKADYYNAIAAEVAMDGGAYGGTDDSAAAEYGGSGYKSSLPALPPPPPNVPTTATLVPPPIQDTKDKEHTGVLWMRGLPFSATKPDVIEFFQGFDLTENNVHIVHSSEGRSTGEGFVEFATAGDARAAMGKDRCKMGTRYVELFPSSREEAIMRVAAKGKSNP